MMSQDQMVDAATDLVMACIHGRVDEQWRVIGTVLRTGEQVDVLGVVSVLATAVGDGAALPPGREFHQLQVVDHGPAGPQRGDAAELPPPARTFMQIVVALLNRDHDMARDLFIGYVGVDAVHAARLLSVGSGLAAGRPVLGCGCPVGSHR